MSQSGGVAHQDAARSVQVTDLHVSGMTCASCVARVERKLNKLPGVQASVDLATESAHIVGSTTVPLADLIAAVRTAGYDATLRAFAGDTDAEGAARARDLRTRLWVAVLLGVPVVAISMVMPWHFTGWQWWAAALSAPIAWWSALPFHRVALRQLRHRSSSMDTLVSLGVIAAWCGSVYALLRARAAGQHTLHTTHVWFEVVAAVTAFLLLGRLLEHRATRESGVAIRALLALQSVTARRRNADGSVEEIASELVLAGDMLIINPGEVVPVDGVIIEGRTAVDESMLTGESVPVDAGIDDVLTGGTVVVNGQVSLRATAVGAATRIAQISELVLQAQSRKSQMHRLADRISSVFVPVVLGVAALTAGAWTLIGHGNTAVTAAIAVLVVACPCALGLATPTAMLAGVGRGARAGILISGPEVLERASAVDTIVFDKTGTLTSGELRVVEASGIERLSVAQWRWVAGIASASSHPVSRAIAAFAVARGHTPETLTDVSEQAGAGVSARCGDVTLRLGRTEWVSFRELLTSADASVDEQAAWRDAGYSVVAFGIDGVIAAEFAIADRPRDVAAQVVSQAREHGLTPWLVTGDHASVAASVAQHVGVSDSETRSSVTPEGKQALISELQSSGRHVVMVGDGINDSAALALADIGIAMGGGTGAAIAASDITLVGSNLSRVVPALVLARRTLSTIKVNLFWAFAYNIVMIPLAALGRLDPMIAGFAMAASSVLVVSNSLRLRQVPLD